MKFTVKPIVTAAIIISYAGAATAAPHCSDHCDMHPAPSGVDYFTPTSTTAPTSHASITYISNPSDDEPIRATFAFGDQFWTSESKT